MCDQNAYLMEGNQETLLMEAVNYVTPEGNGLKLTNIFGEQKIVKAQIHTLALNDKKILLVPASS